MPTYAIGTPIAVAGLPGEVHTTRKNTVGTEATFLVDGRYKTYIYLPGVASCIAGSWVTYDEAGVTVGLVTPVTGLHAVAIATAATVAGTFGWFGVDGVFTARALAAFADNAKVFPTATVFVVDDTSVAGSQIVPAVGRSVEAAGLAQVEVHHPFVGVNIV
jgi:hypothetical protein